MIFQNQSNNNNQQQAPTLSLTERINYLQQLTGFLSDDKIEPLKNLYSFLKETSESTFNTTSGGGNRNNNNNNFYLHHHHHHPTSSTSHFNNNNSQQSSSGTSGFLSLLDSQQQQQQQMMITPILLQQTSSSSSSATIPTQQHTTTSSVTEIFGNQICSNIAIVTFTTSIKGMLLRDTSKKQIIEGIHIYRQIISLLHQNPTDAPFTFKLGSPVLMFLRFTIDCVFNFRQQQQNIMNNKIVHDFSSMILLILSRPQYLNLLKLDIIDSLFHAVFDRVCSSLNDLMEGRNPGSSVSLQQQCQDVKCLVDILVILTTQLPNWWNKMYQSREFGRIVRIWFEKVFIPSFSAKISLNWGSNNSNNQNISNRNNNNNNNTDLDSTNWPHQIPVLRVSTAFFVAIQEIGDVSLLHHHNQNNTNNSNNDDDNNINARQDHEIMQNFGKYNQRKQELLTRRQAPALVPSSLKRNNKNGDINNNNDDDDFSQELQNQEQQQQFTQSTSSYFSDETLHDTTSLTVQKSLHRIVELMRYTNRGDHFLNEAGSFVASFVQCMFTVGETDLLRTIIKQDSLLQGTVECVDRFVKLDRTADQGVIYLASTMVSALSLLEHGGLSASSSSLKNNNNKTNQKKNAEEMNNNKTKKTLSGQRRQRGDAGTMKKSVSNESCDVFGDDDDQDDDQPLVEDDDDQNENESDIEENNTDSNNDDDESSSAMAELFWSRFSRSASDRTIWCRVVLQSLEKLIVGYTAAAASPSSTQTTTSNNINLNNSNNKEDQIPSTSNSSNNNEEKFKRSLLFTHIRPSPTRRAKDQLIDLMLSALMMKSSSSSTESSNNSKKNENNNNTGIDFFVSDLTEIFLDENISINAWQLLFTHPEIRKQVGDSDNNNNNNNVGENVVLHFFSLFKKKRLLTLPQAPKLFRFLLHCCPQAYITPRVLLDLLSHDLALKNAKEELYRPLASQLIVLISKTIMYHYNGSHNNNNNNNKEMFLGRDGGGGENHNNNNNSSSSSSFSPTSDIHYLLEWIGSIWRAASPEALSTALVPMLVKLSMSMMSNSENSYFAPHGFYELFSPLLFSSSKKRHDRNDVVPSATSATKSSSDYSTSSTYKMSGTIIVDDQHAAVASLSPFAESAFKPKYPLHECILRFLCFVTAKQFYLKDKDTFVSQNLMTMPKRNSQYDQQQGKSTSGNDVKSFSQEQLQQQQQQQQQSSGNTANPSPTANTWFLPREVPLVINNSNNNSSSSPSNNNNNHNNNSALLDFVSFIDFNIVDSLEQLCALSFPEDDYGLAAASSSTHNNSNNNLPWTLLDHVFSQFFNKRIWRSTLFFCQSNINFNSRNAASLKKIIKFALEDVSSLAATNNNNNNSPSNSTNNNLSIASAARVAAMISQIASYDPSLATSSSSNSFYSSLFRQFPDQTTVANKISSILDLTQEEIDNWQAQNQQDQRKNPHGNHERFPPPRIANMPDVDEAVTYLSALYLVNPKKAKLHIRNFLNGVKMSALNKMRIAPLFLRACASCALWLVPDAAEGAIHHRYSDDALLRNNNYQNGNNKNQEEDEDDEEENEEDENNNIDVKNPFKMIRSDPPSQEEGEQQQQQEHPRILLDDDDEDADEEVVKGKFDVLDDPLGLSRNKLSKQNASQEEIEEEEGNDIILDDDHFDKRRQAATINNNVSSSSQFVSSDAAVVSAQQQQQNNNNSFNHFIDEDCQDIGNKYHLAFHPETKSVKELFIGGEVILLCQTLQLFSSSSSSNSNSNSSSTDLFDTTFSSRDQDSLFSLLVTTCLGLCRPEERNLFIRQTITNACTHHKPSVREAASRALSLVIDGLIILKDEQEKEEEDQNQNNNLHQSLTENNNNKKDSRAATSIMNKYDCSVSRIALALEPVIRKLGSRISNFISDGDSSKVTKAFDLAMLLLPFSTEIIVTVLSQVLIRLVAEMKAPMFSHDNLFVSSSASTSSKNKSNNNNTKTGGNKKPGGKKGGKNTKNNAKKEDNNNNKNQSDENNIQQNVSSTSTSSSLFTPPLEVTIKRNLDRLAEFLSSSSGNTTSRIIPSPYLHHHAHQQCKNLAAVFLPFFPALCERLGYQRHLTTVAFKLFRFLSSEMERLADHVNRFGRVASSSRNNNNQTSSSSTATIIVKHQYDFTYNNQAYILIDSSLPYVINHLRASLIRVAIFLCDSNNLGNNNNNINNNNNPINSDGELQRQCKVVFAYFQRERRDFAKAGSDIEWSGVLSQFMPSIVAFLARSAVHLGHSTISDLQNQQQQRYQENDDDNVDDDEQQQDDANNQNSNKRHQKRIDALLNRNKTSSSAGTEQSIKAREAFEYIKNQIGSANLTERIIKQLDEILTNIIEEVELVTSSPGNLVESAWEVLLHDFLGISPREACIKNVILKINNSSNSAVEAMMKKARTGGSKLKVEANAGMLLDDDDDNESQYNKNNNNNNASSTTTIDSDRLTGVLDRFCHRLYDQRRVLSIMTPALVIPSLIKKTITSTVSPHNNESNNNSNSKKKTVITVNHHVSIVTTSSVILPSHHHQEHEYEEEQDQHQNNSCFFSSIVTRRTIFFSRMISEWLHYSLASMQQNAQRYYNNTSNNSPSSFSSKINLASSLDSSVPILKRTVDCLLLMLSKNLSSSSSASSSLNSSNDNGTSNNASLLLLNHSILQTHTSSLIHAFRALAKQDIEVACDYFPVCCTTLKLCQRQQELFSSSSSVAVDFVRAVRKTVPQSDWRVALATIDILGNNNNNNTRSNNDNHKNQQQEDNTDAAVTKTSSSSGNNKKQDRMKTVLRALTQSKTAQPGSQQQQQQMMMMKQNSSSPSNQADKKNKKRVKMENNINESSLSDNSDNDNEDEDEMMNLTDNVVISYIARRQDIPIAGPALEMLTKYFDSLLVLSSSSSSSPTNEYQQQQHQQTLPVSTPTILSAVRHRLAECERILSQQQTRADTNMFSSFFSSHNNNEQQHQTDVSALLQLYRAISLALMRYKIQNPFEVTSPLAVAANHLLEGSSSQDSFSIPESSFLKSPIEGWRSAIADLAESVGRIATQWSDPRQRFLASQLIRHLGDRHRHYTLFVSRNSNPAVEQSSLGAQSLLVFVETLKKYSSNVADFESLLSPRPVSSSSSTAMSMSMMGSSTSSSISSSSKAIASFSSSTTEYFSHDPDVVGDLAEIIFEEDRPWTDENLWPGSFDSSSFSASSSIDYCLLTPLLLGHDEIIKKDEVLSSARFLATASPEIAKKLFALSTIFIFSHATTLPVSSRSTSSLANAPYKRSFDNNNNNTAAAMRSFTDPNGTKFATTNTTADCRQHRGFLEEKLGIMLQRARQSPSDAKVALQVANILRLAHISVVRDMHSHYSSTDPSSSTTRNNNNNSSTTGSSSVTTTSTTTKGKVTVSIDEMLDIEPQPIFTNENRGIWMHCFFSPEALVKAAVACGDHLRAAQFLETAAGEAVTKEKLGLTTLDTGLNELIAALHRGKDGEGQVSFKTSYRTYQEKIKKYYNEVNRLRYEKQRELTRNELPPRPVAPALSKHGDQFQHYQRMITTMFSATEFNNNSGNNSDNSSSQQQQLSDNTLFMIDPTSARSTSAADWTFGSAALPEKERLLRSGGNQQQQQQKSSMMTLRSELREREVKELWSNFRAFAAVHLYELNRHLRPNQTESTRLTDLIEGDCALLNDTSSDSAVSSSSTTTSNFSSLLREFGLRNTARKISSDRNAIVSSSSARERLSSWSSTTGTFDHSIEKASESIWRGNYIDFKSNMKNAELALLSSSLSSSSSSSTSSATLCSQLQILRDLSTRNKFFEEIGYISKRTGNAFISGKTMFSASSPQAASDPLAGVASANFSAVHQRDDFLLRHLARGYQMIVDENRVANSTVATSASKTSSPTELIHFRQLYYLSSHACVAASRALQASAPHLAIRMLANCPQTCDSTWEARVDFLAQSLEELGDVKKAVSVLQSAVQVLESNNKRAIELLFMQHFDRPSKSDLQDQDYIKSQLNQIQQQRSSKKNNNNNNSTSSSSFQQQLPIHQQLSLAEREANRRYCHLAGSYISLQARHQLTPSSALVDENHSNIKMFASCDVDAAFTLAILCDKLYTEFEQKITSPEYRNQSEHLANQFIEARQRVESGGRSQHLSKVENNRISELTNEFKMHLNKDKELRKSSKNYRKMALEQYKYVLRNEGSIHHNTANNSTNNNSSMMINKSYDQDPSKDLHAAFRLCSLYFSGMKILKEQQELLLLQQQQRNNNSKNNTTQVSGNASSSSSSTVASPNTTSPHFVSPQFAKAVALAHGAITASGSPRGGANINTTNNKIDYASSILFGDDIDYNDGTNQQNNNSSSTSTNFNFILGEEVFKSVPLHKLVFLIPQLVAHLQMPTNPAEQHIKNTLQRLLLSHPHHTVWSLLAIFNSDKFLFEEEERNLGFDEKRRDAASSIFATINNQCVNAQNFIAACESGKVQQGAKVKGFNEPASQQLLNHCKGVINGAFGSVYRIFDEAHRLWMAYFEIAADKVKERSWSDKFSKVVIPKDKKTPHPKIRSSENSIMLMTMLRNMKHCAIPCSSVPVSPLGQYDSRSLPCLLAFEQEYSFVGGIHAPKKITVRTTTGQTCHQLVKAHDDLRQDCVIQQVFELCNKLFRHGTRASDRAMREFRIRTYSVVPLSALTGVVEWVDKTDTMNGWLLGPKTDYKLGARHRYFPSELTSNEARDILSSYNDRSSTSSRLDAFEEITSQMTPVLHYFFSERYGSPAEWFTRMNCYSRSLACCCFIGYLVGLGDRHSGNVLIDLQSAELVQIDLGLAFDQGTLLPQPEVVPFRLTREVVDGLGVEGVKNNSSFQYNSQKVLNSLRDHKDLFRTVLEVLLYDPISKWSVDLDVTTTKQQQQQQQMINNNNNNATTSNPDFYGIPNQQQQQSSPSSSKSLLQQQQLANKAKALKTTMTSDADRALTRVRERLDGYEGAEFLSVESQVHKLIGAATSSENLSQMYPGWAPWL